MGWPRDITVTIDGTDHTSETLDGVYVQRGRPTYWDGVQAGICQVTLIDPTVRPEIGKPLTVDVELSTSTLSRIFTGRIQQTISQYDPNVGPIVQVIALGPLAKTGRREQDDTLPQQLDGQRIADLLESGLSEQWVEQPLDQTWDDVDPSLTWDDYGIDPTIIDPGVYEMAPIASVPVNVLEQLALTAFSGNGVVYETGDGRVGYADSTRRQGNTFDPPLVLDGSEVLALSATATSAFEDIVNQGIINWSGGQITYNAVNSVAEYGYVSREYQTILDELLDAIAFSERLVTLQAFPGQTLQGPLSVRLEVVNDALTDELLTLEINQDLDVTGIPTQVLPSGDFLGFVEGVNFELTPFAAEVQIFASDAKFSIYETRWVDVSPTAVWDDVLATLTWQDA